MRLGCCGWIHDVGQIKHAGFDYLEINVQNELRGDEPSSTWDKTAADPDKLPLPIESANALVGPNHPIIGPQRSMTGLQDYMQRVAKRGQRMGVKRMVFGSALARKRADDVSTTTAFQHLCEFTRMAGEICAHHDIILVIEHLNKSECNTINSLAEELELCDTVNHPSVACLVDSFHIGLEKESDEAILELGDRIRHVHVAEVFQRGQPGVFGTPDQNPDAFDFENFLCVLRKAGYDERVSVECNWTLPVASPAWVESAAKPSAKYLRTLWEQAGACEE